MFDNRDNTEFKIGDRVKLIEDDEEDALEKNDTGLIVNSDGVLKVQWDLGGEDTPIHLVNIIMIKEY